MLISRYTKANRNLRKRVKTVAGNLSKEVNLYQVLVQERDEERMPEYLETIQKPIFHRNRVSAGNPNGKIKYFSIRKSCIMLNLKGL